MPFLRTGIVKETLFLVKNTSAEIAMIFTEVLFFVFHYNFAA